MILDITPVIVKYTERSLEFCHSLSYIEGPLYQLQMAPC